MMSRSALQNSTMSNKKGRTKVASSFLAFELDEKSIRYFVNENKEQIFSALYDQMKSGFKLLFLSKHNSILQRFQTEMPFNIETRLIRDMPNHKMKDEISKILTSQMTDRIRPDQSIFVGNLFGPEDMNNKRFFRFGKVYNPTSYITSILNVKPVKSPEDPRIMSTSPDHTADMEFENQEDHDHSFVESKPNSVGRHPFDDMMSSHSSSNHKNSLLLELNHGSIIPEFQIQNKNDTFLPDPAASSMLYEKLKELNERVSSRLSVKLRQIKAKELTLREFQEEIELSFATPFKGFFENKSTLLGKRRGDFENDASNEYVNKKLEKMRRSSSVFDIFESNLKEETFLEMSSKIKSINFMATNEADTCPIMKRIKATESKAIENNDPQWEKEAILEYKSRERQSSIVVYGRDLQRLDQNSYLNDTLIEFYLKFVQNELMEESKRDSVHIFNTFFLERLRASNKSDKNGFQDSYNNVKKWTKDVDIFEKDFLVFPMNDRNGKHWNLFILCYPRYFLEKSEHDENAAVTQRKPFLLYFDSMNVLPQQDPEIPKLISCYMQFELKDKKPLLYNQIQNRFNGITENRICQVIVPFQDNLFDCGIYMLEYAEKFLTEPDQILKDVTINKDKLNLFPKSIFRNKRADIASIILNLAKGDQNVAKEYQRNRQARIEAAKKNPDEFEVINEEDTIAFLNDELNVRYEDLPPEQRAHVKLIVYKQAHENQLARILSSKAGK